MKTSSKRIAVLLAIIAPFLVLHPTMARGATVTVTVGTGGFIFKPSDITINVGDTVRWTWGSSGHSSTSGSPGMPTGLWDSLVLNQGAAFMHTFNTAGTFPYYCVPHGACCGMVGSVTVVGQAVGATGIGLVELFKLPSASPLVNISTRLNVLNGDNVLIGGFVIGGPDNKKVVLRAIGPSLANPPINLTGVLADPMIEVHDANGIIGTNDNWKDTQQAVIAATGLEPTNDLESAVLLTLAPGSYTAIVRGNNGGSGIGLVEAYDADLAANSTLANISTRGFVNTGDNVMIGGFVTGAGGSATVVVRAIGPSLSNPPFNLTGVLQDPTLSLFDANGAMIASNDNWKDTQQAELQATGLAPTDDRESAILVTLPAGSFTVIVRGK